MKRVRAIAICLISILAFTGKTASHSWHQVEQTIYTYAFDWNEDGSKLALITQDDVRIYDAHFQLLGVYPSDNPNEIFALAWSHDGNRLIAGNIILDATTFKSLVTIKTEARPFQWSPDDKSVTTFALDYKGIERYDSQTGQLVETLSTGGFQMADEPILSPDGSRFLAKDTCCGLIIIDAIKGGVILRVDSGQPMGGFIWSLDSNRIAYNSFQLVPNSTPKTFAIADSPTNGMLLKIDILDSHSGQILQEFNPFPYDPGNLQWSPDGSEITATFSGVVTWDTETGQVVDAYRPDKRVIAAAYSPNGGRLVLALWPYIDSPPESVTTFQALSTFKQSYLDGSIEIISPAASMEKLAAIQAQCAENAPNSTMRADIPKSEADLTAYTARLGAISDTEIPPGCKADLLAVANALMAQPQ